MRNNCTATVILRTDKKSKRTGLCPLALQVFINGGRRVLSLNLYIKPSDWDKEHRKILSNNFDLKAMNMVLDKQLSKANQIFIDYHLLEKELTPDRFVEEFTEKANRNDFIAFYEKEMDRRLASEVISKGTYKGQKSTLAKLKKFKSEIKFSELDADLIEKFDSWHRKYLRKSCEKMGKIQVMDSKNTREKAKSHIRTYVKLAIKRRGIKITDPFNVIKVKNVQSSRTFLEKEELIRFDNLFLSEKLNDHLQATLAKFMFACLTSLRIGDSIRLFEIKVQDNQLVFLPEKGRRKAKKVTIPMNNNAQRYYKYLKGIDFRIVSDVKINKALKKIAIAAEVHKHITFHVARHTFGTQFIANGGDVTVLKEIMGHEDIRTTMIYVHMAKDFKREQIMFMDGMFENKEAPIQEHLS
jgi:integrase/recombinase XerD